MKINEKPTTEITSHNLSLKIPNFADDDQSTSEFPMKRKLSFHSVKSGKSSQKGEKSFTMSGKSTPSGLINRSTNFKFPKRSYQRYRETKQERTNLGEIEEVRESFTEVLVHTKQAWIKGIGIICTLMKLGLSWFFERVYDLINWALWILLFLLKRIVLCIILGYLFVMGFFPKKKRLNPFSTSSNKEILKKLDKIWEFKKMKLVLGLGNNLISISSQDPRKKKSKSKKLAMELETKEIQIRRVAYPTCKVYVTIRPFLSEFLEAVIF